MEIRNAGVFSRNKYDLDVAFHAHAAQVMFYGDRGYRVKSRDKIIITDDVKWQYFHVENLNDCQKFAGISFAAVFVDDVDPEVKNYIKSRFRFR